MPSRSQPHGASDGADPGRRRHDRHLEQRTVRRSEVAAAQLQASLTSRIAIEQAKGVLAERLQTSADDAFEVLHRAARSRNLLLSELARDVASGSPDVAQLLLVMFPPTRPSSGIVSERQPTVVLGGRRHYF